MLFFSIFCLQLQFYQFVRFSRYGTFLETSNVFVDISEISYSANEIEDELEIDVLERILRPCKNGKVISEKISGVYIYVSADPANRKRYLLPRSKIESIPAVGGLWGDILNHELKVAIILFQSPL